MVLRSWGSIVSGGVLLTGLVAGVAGPSAADASSGAVFSWGDNTSGQLGDGTTTRSTVPIAVDTSGYLAGKTVTKVAAGSYGACALTSDGLVYCWGYGGGGFLGNGSTSNSSVPVPIDNTGVMDEKTVIDIAVLSSSACALTLDGRVYCWGSGSTFGELGTGTLEDSTVPLAVDTSGILSGRTVTSLAVGGFATTCAVLDDGTAACWGAGLFGSIGNGTNNISNAAPAAVNTSGVLAGKTIASIASGVFHVCALTTDATLACWGRDNAGQLGDDSALSNKNVPVLVDTSGALSGLTVTAVAAGNETTCAIASGEVFCWGSGAEGALGSGSTSNVAVPQAVDTSGVLAGQRATLLAMGSYTHTCVVTASNLVSCWGAGTSGELGDGQRTSTTVPVLVDQSGVLDGQVVTGIAGADYQTYVVARAPGAASSTAPSAEFTYYLPDGRECSRISPELVILRTAVALPGEDADCRTRGAVVAGWTIPGSDRVFRPGAVVYVVDSQQFTAVLREPVVTVRYRANVAAGDSCLSASGEVASGDRVDTVWLTRDQVGAVPLANWAVCAPPGHRLVGWTWREGSSLTVFAAGETVPESWNVEGTHPVNDVDLYAVWEAVGA